MIQPEVGFGTFFIKVPNFNDRPAEIRGEVCGVHGEDIGYHPLTG